MGHEMFALCVVIANTYTKNDLSLNSVRDESKLKLLVSENLF